MALVTGVFIAVFAILLYLWIAYRKNAQGVLKKMGVPGPEPSILFGNYHQVRWPSDHFRLHIPILAEWQKKFGRVFGYYEGTRPRIMVTDLDVIRQVFIKQSDTFTNRPDMNRSMKNILSLNDQRWKTTRHVLTPTFSAHKLKQMTQMMEECDDIFIEVIEGKRKADGDEIEIINLLQNVTLDVIFKCVLAMNMDCQRQERETLKQLKAIFNFNVTIPFYLKLIFNEFSVIWNILATVQKKQRVLDFLGNKLEGVMSARRQMDQSNFKDVLQLLLEAAAGKHEEEKRLNKNLDVDSDAEMTASLAEKLKNKALLTDPEIRDNAILFLLAGYETTSNALTYTLFCLSRHLDVQKKAHEEVDRVTGKKDKVTYEDVCNLVYLEQVLDESMRMYPPVVTLVSRACKKTTKIGEWTFPEGCVVEAPVWMLHHDPEYWQEPEKFDPDRFAPQNKSANQQLAFCPFGIGPRKCIGERFALLEAKLFLARVLRKYKILPSLKTKDPLKTVVRTLMMNPLEVWVKFAPRD